MYTVETKETGIYFPLKVSFVYGRIQTPIEAPFARVLPPKAPIWGWNALAAPLHNKRKEVAYRKEGVKKRLRSDLSSSPSLAIPPPVAQEPREKQRERERARRETRRWARSFPFVGASFVRTTKDKRFPTPRLSLYSSFLSIGTPPRTNKLSLYSRGHVSFGSSHKCRHGGWLSRRRPFGSNATNAASNHHAATAIAQCGQSLVAVARFDYDSYSWFPTPPQQAQQPQKES